METAFRILGRMEEDAIKGRIENAPDTVTYNTLLAVVGGAPDYSSIHHIEGGEIKYNFALDKIQDKDDEGIAFVHGGSREKLVNHVLDKMEKTGVERSVTTYRNAIVSCWLHPNEAIHVLKRALHDSKFIQTSSRDACKAIAKKREVFYAAVRTCALRGDLNCLADVFDEMQKHGIKSNSKDMKQLIRALGQDKNTCLDSMVALNAMKGDSVANKFIFDTYRIDIIKTLGEDNPIVETDHHSLAITSCLNHGELFVALKVLNAMKIHGLQPSDASLRGIILAYCRLATEASSEEFKIAKKESTIMRRNASKKSVKYPAKKKKSSRPTLIHAVHKTSATRASAALQMLHSLDKPPASLMSAVASACASAGMWIEARKILWEIQVEAKKEWRSRIEISVAMKANGGELSYNYQEIMMEQNRKALEEVPRLHRSLLKLCARCGNVTAALWYVDAIQDLNTKLCHASNSTSLADFIKVQNIIENQELSNVGNATMDINTLNAHESSDISKQILKTHGIGMSAEDWKLLIIAASKSGHWKVCLGSLQFLRPYIEETHPNGASSTSLSRHILDRKYEKLARALTSTILSFELRSQYAWAVRVIDDWMEWSGRRPRKEAVFSACRILAERNRGHEVKALIYRILQMPYSNEHIYEGEGIMIPNTGIIDYNSCYEVAVYTEAISALHKNGFYQHADDLYAAAAAGGYLPIGTLYKTISNEIPESEIKFNQLSLKLDLHGMNRAIAHSAVRVSLQHLIQTNDVEINSFKVIIVTGRGNRSAQKFRPILRPEVQRMLQEEFYPPLNTVSIPGNIGALEILESDVSAWIEHQTRQKEVRLLTIADILKNISGGERLRKALSKKIELDMQESSPPSDDS